MFSSVLESLKFITCIICRENFDQKFHKPIMLPCQHTFCRQCITQMMHENEFGNNAICSVCRTPHSTIENDLHVDRKVMVILELIENHKCAYGSDKLNDLTSTMERDVIETSSIQVSTLCNCTINPY